jgi:citrate synthase
MDIPQALYTPTFAVSRVSGWTARIQEYLQNNRIFRPRAMYRGALDAAFVPLHERGRKRGRR